MLSSLEKVYEVQPIIVTNYLSLLTNRGESTDPPVVTDEPVEFEK
jgi:hypothetical protein